MSEVDRGIATAMYCRTSADGVCVQPRRKAPWWRVLRCGTLSVHNMRRESLNLPSQAGSCGFCYVAALTGSFWATPTLQSMVVVDVEWQMFRSSDGLLDVDFPDQSAARSASSGL
jgi:hypothetical protein